MTQRQVKAAVLLIGDEILSGRTQDINLQAIAKYLAPLGVQLAEARVAPDVPEEIVSAVNALRAKYDYVFTTGGIGPTTTTRQLMRWRRHSESASMSARTRVRSLKRTIKAAPD
jgi:molybdopterin biosynthesis enzyme MoaB